MHALLVPTLSNVVQSRASRCQTRVGAAVFMLCFRVFSPCWYSSSSRHSPHAGCSRVAQSSRALGVRALCTACSAAVRWRAARAAARPPRTSCFSLIAAVIPRAAPLPSSKFDQDFTCAHLPRNTPLGLVLRRAARALKGHLIPEVDFGN